MTRIRPSVATGTVRVPGSKSVTHRAFLLAAQAATPCTVTTPLRGADTDATLACLHRLGHRVQPEQRAVRFLPAPATPPTEILDCRNSGTTLRLLAATVARHPWPTILDGDSSLRSRPNAPLLAALRSLGARVVGDDTAPVTVQGPIGPGRVVLPPGSSSQYASGLLLSLPFLAGPSQVVLEGPVASAPYLDVTLDVAAAFGLLIEEVPQTGHGAARAAAVARAQSMAASAASTNAAAAPSVSASHPSRGALTSRTFNILGGDTPRRDHFAVEGDWSTAAFFLAAGAIAGGPVTVRGLRADSRQGDRAIIEHLAAFGALMRSSAHSESGAPVFSAATPSDGLASPGTVDVSATPDLFPILCVVAAYARGTTTFTGGAALRRKESDRIRAMAQGLAAMGIQVEEKPDGLVVHGGTLRGATLHCHDDHRIHMALCIAALGAEGASEVDGAASVAVSHPNFHTDLAHLTDGAVRDAPESTAANPLKPKEAP